MNFQIYLVKKSPKVQEPEQVLEKRFARVDGDGKGGGPRGDSTVVNSRNFYQVLYINSRWKIY